MAMYRMMCLAALLLLSGCGESVKPGRGVPVSGKITLGGKPLADADVLFTNDTFVGFGKTDAEGNYRLVQGALPGQNRVSLSKYEGGKAPTPTGAPGGDGMDAGQMAAAQMGWGNEKKQTGPKQLVPADYADPATTKLTFDVSAEGSSGVDFNL
ncbi:MAG: hypothetical protein RLZZ536_3591 [Planctomycetota bacterium]